MGCLLCFPPWKLPLPLTILLLCVVALRSGHTAGRESARLARVDSYPPLPSSRNASPPTTRLFAVRS